MDLQLKGKVAVITGGAKGIGKGIAECLAGEGVNVVINYRSDPENAAKVEKDFTEKYGVGVLMVQGDAGLQETIDRVFDEAKSKFGRVDILINNAQSLPPSASVEDTLYESMYLAWSTGTIGSLNFMQACFPYMKEQGEGRIINFASATGMFGYAGQLAYASNKESIRGLTKIAAKEWAKYGITVNVCLPGAESPAAKAWKEKFPDLYEKQMEQLPMHRLGDPETDIGAALTFLAGPDSKFYSGQSFILDGANSIMP